MKARDYIEHNFIPWILFLDKDNTIYHFVKGKEEYLCELYNHITEEFKALEFYELYMFRIQASKTMLPIGMCDVISAKLPPVKVPKDAGYIMIIYNDSKLYYYTVDFLMDDTYQVVKVSKHEKKAIGTVRLDPVEIMDRIKADLLEI